MPPAAWSRFLPLWLAQTLSMTCGGLTNFALGVWVYTRTGSATQYALLSVVSVLPGLLALPLLGVWIDRLGARRGLLLADAAGLVFGALLVAAIALGAASPAVLLPILTIRNLFTAAHWPAYSAATTLLVGRERVARAAALLQFGYVGQQVLAPAIAGALLGALKGGVAGIVAIDATSYALALFTTLAASIPRDAAASAAPVRQHLAESLAIIRRTGLLRLSLYLVVTYLFGGLVVALATPLVLGFTTPATAGAVTSTMGAGMLVGSVMAARFIRVEGGFSRLLRYDSLVMISMVGIAVARTPAALAALGFVFLFGVAGLFAEEQAMWQVRVAPEAQVRVFALRRLITWGSLPLSYALAGPLADRVFDPLVRAPGFRGSWLEAIVGAGPARGIALLLVCGGLLKAITILVARRDPGLQRLDGAAATPALVDAAG